MFGNVPQNANFGIQVPLPQNTSLPLRDIGGTPRAVQVMQCDGPRLHVRTDPKLFRRADEHGDGPGAACGEQLSLVPIGPCLMNEPDRFPRQAPRDQLVP